MARALACFFFGLALIHAALVQAHPHQVPGNATSHLVLAATDRPAGQTFESGTGPFRYRYVPGLLPLPDGVNMLHGHGLAVAPSGDIYFNFEQKDPVTRTTRTLIRFSADGKRAVLLGSPTLSSGTPHGLDLFVENDGTPFLYHANNQQKFSKTDLSGYIIWQHIWPDTMGNFRPTDVAPAPNGKHLFLADGYGSSMVHTFLTEDGRYAGHSFGGGKTAKHGHFKTPHGITYDARKGQMVISDRGNSRMEYYTLDGLYDHTVDPPEITEPCSAFIWQDHMLVANLDGTVVIMDKDNKVVSVVEVSKLLGEFGHQHPHDAVFTQTGDIVVATWNPGRVSYWQRLP